MRAGWIAVLGVVVFLGVEPSAMAQSDNLEEQRAAAAALSAANKHADCGKAYLEIASAHPDDPSAVTDLFSAAVCFEKGGLIGLALVALDQVAKRGGSSDLVPRAVMWSAELNEGLARFDVAAGLYESHARRYAGEASSREGLARAIALRRGIGDRKAALADSELFIKRYQRKAPERVAEVALAIVAIHADDGDQRGEARALERYLADFAAGGSAAARVRAHGRLGEILWRQSCKRAATDGTCVRAVRRRAKAVQRVCKETAGPRLEAVKRDARLVARAHDHFNKAIAIAERPNASPRARRAAALSRFLLAGSSFEASLSVSFPTGLSFDPKRPELVKASQKRFMAWLETRTRTGEALQRQYTAVVESGDPAWSAAAAYRIGQIAEGFATALFSAEVPRSVQRGPYGKEATEAYCAALSSAAAPLDERAVSAFAFCAERASSSQWTPLCIAALERLRPEDYPAMLEVRPRGAGAAGTRIQATPMIAPPADGHD